ncbi:MAG: tagaturonate reductase [Bacteroidota bacterium]
MQLNNQNLPFINTPFIELPQKDLLSLPEKVLQFGTGVLLRGLPDYFIDQANKKKVFNGRVVVVKSTSKENIDSFSKQDGLYTILVRGIEDGKQVNKTIINAAISRVLTANENWNEILLFAQSPDLKIIISNTTEVGICLLKESIFLNPPNSFPAKLLAVLWNRFEYFRGDEEMGLVIIPAELISENGKLLKSILNELSIYNQLETDFIKWLNESNDFCNSLVDRIVPGKLSADKKLIEDSLLGYQDDLMILCEPYSLWAIESSKRKTIETLSFAISNPTVKVVPDINAFKELKLRLLNGTHSFSCALAIFCGFDTVKEAMQTDYFRKFVKLLMFEEIKPLLISESIHEQEAQIFAEQVLDRFSNESIEHKWINISMQYSLKMAIRNVPLILKNKELHKSLPKSMMLGFAAYLLFMKTEIGNDGLYYKSVGNQLYHVNDSKAELLYKYWDGKNTFDAVNAILSDRSIWGTDLNKIDGFCEILVDVIGELDKGTENLVRSLFEKNK